MKILKIKIKNINCLRNEWEIDFQSPPLSEAGLFAITGPTGSGKSTILDAITLALFNRIPRFESDTISKGFIERSGSVVTINETDCFAEVDYSCSKGIFRSKWSVATNRRGGLRETDMELIDMATNKPIISGKKDVPKQNTELIGLTYDQFIKSILLSQGEFARFLKSKEDERARLLQDITGMNIYTELGKGAYEKLKGKNDAIRLRTELIDSEEKHLLSKETEDELSELIRTSALEIRNNESDLAAIQKAIEVNDQIRSIEREIEKHKQEEREIESALEIFNEKNAERISGHERLLPHLDQIRKYVSNHNSLKEVTEKIHREEPELSQSRRHADHTLDAIGKLIGTKVEKHNAVDLLTKFRDRVIYLTMNKRAAEKTLDELKTKFLGYFKNPNLAAYKNYESRTDELKSKLVKDLSLLTAKTEALVQQTKIRTDDLSKQKESLSATLKAMSDLKLQVERYTENRTQLKEIEKQITEAVELINHNTPKLEKISALKTSVSLQIHDVREKREKKLREEKLEEQRRSLKAGEPCPLCGSLHHPYIHEYINNISELTKELQGLEEKENEHEREIQNLQRAMDRQSGTLQALQEEKSGIAKKMAEEQTKIKRIKQELKIDKVGKIDTIEAMIAEVDRSLNAISELEDMVRTRRDLEDLTKAVDELVLRSDEFEKARSELESSYKGVAIRKDCDELSQQLNNYTEAIQKSEANINSYKRQLEELTTQQGRMERSLGVELSAFGYASVLSSSGEILADAEFNRLKQELSDLKGNVKKVKAFIQAANERKQQLIVKDEATRSKEQLLEELAAIAEKIERTKQNLEEYRVQHRENTSRKNRIIKLKEEINETRQANLKWELLSKYIGDAQGKNFSTFAQGLTLRKLILLANERLQKLNDRYLLDIPLEEEDDDLVIIDNYLGEDRRSVKTLSGGETFIVSLALALALSDLASKNVKIESLYVDEGFGSLDPEALDVAISTLEQLQAESNKTIGIISHIDSLKERIETQIQLEKNSSGFSKIVITQA